MECVYEVFGWEANNESFTFGYFVHLHDAVLSIEALVDKYNKSDQFVWHKMTPTLLSFVHRDGESVPIVIDYITREQYQYIGINKIRLNVGVNADIERTCWDDDLPIEYSIPVKRVDLI